MQKSLSTRTQKYFKAQLFVEVRVQEQLCIKRMSSKHLYVQRCCLSGPSMLESQLVVCDEQYTSSNVGCDALAQRASIFIPWLRWKTFHWARRWLVPRFVISTTNNGDNSTPSQSCVFHGIFHLYSAYLVQDSLNLFFPFFVWNVASIFRFDPIRSIYYSHRLYRFEQSKTIA